MQRPGPIVIVGAACRGAVGLLLAALLLAAPVRADILVLPSNARALLEAINAACPECAEQGFLPCGAADVQYGKRFATTAMQGRPQRAYLLARAPVSRELVPMLSVGERQAVIGALRRRFADLRLAVIERNWRTVRLLSPAGAAEVTVDAKQQACFRDPARNLSCCLGDGPRDAGCLPKADPPDVRFAFVDKTSGDRLALRYPIGKGEITVRRRTPGKARPVVYWCQKWERARVVSKQ